MALHHLDAPRRPADVEQRVGRILRQGNENKEVAIYRYVTEGSFDAYMWQALETKARFISHTPIASPHSPAVWRENVGCRREQSRTTVGRLTSSSRKLRKPVFGSRC